jgi:hypothetical protein
VLIFKRETNIDLLRQIYNDGSWNNEINGIENEGKRKLVKEFSNFLKTPLNFSKASKALDIDYILRLIRTANLPAGGSISVDEKSNNELLEESAWIKMQKAISSAEKLTSTSGIVPDGISFTTRAIDGAAKFLVDRTKKELAITFFQRFENELNDTIFVDVDIENKEIRFETQLKLVMPNTYLLLNSKEYFDIPSFGPTWISAFKKDLDKMPSSVQNVISQNSEFSKTQIGRYSQMSISFFDKIKEGQHPIEVIRLLSNSYNQFNNSEVDTYLALVQLLSSNNLKTIINGDKEWITLNDLDSLSQIERDYYLGLLIRQGLDEGLFAHVKLYKGVDSNLTLEDIVINNFDQHQMMNAIENIVLSFQSANVLIKKYDKDKNDTSFKQYADYVSKIQGVMDETIKNIYSIVDSDHYYSSDYHLKYSAISNNIANLTRSITNENYGESLLLTLNFIDLMLNPDDKDASKLTKQVAFYGNILVDVLDASKNEKTDISELINNYALPVSSYRIKRSSTYSWDLSAYPGLYGGYEFGESKSFSFGITAPIGFSYSRKRKNSKTNISSSSNSIFLSVIDIGAPISYRFENDEAEGLPENIKLDQIFAPGIFYVYGFKNSPLAVTAGFQFTPLLRSIKNGSNELDAKNVARFQVGLSVDIPIFNLDRGN